MATREENLAKGREKRLRKLRATEYTTLLKKQLQLKKKEEKIITYQQLQKRVEIAQRELRLQGKTATRKAAISAIEYSATFMSRDERFKKAIRDNLSLSDRNRLRKILSTINGTKYKETTIDWNQFYYSDALKGLLHMSNRVSVSIVPGANSTEPDFVEIKEL